MKRHKYECIFRLAVFFIGAQPLGGSDFTKPDIFERPQAQRVHVNETATFTCRARSHTKVKIAWLKDDSKLDSGSGHRILLRNDTLFIMQVRKNDQGIYKCVATNNAGTTSSQATLTVLDALVAPTFFETPENVTLTEGNRVTFTCKATGNPLPEIKWKIRLDHIGKQQLERPSHGSVRILSVAPTDSGQYTCTAENIEGSDVHTFYVKVIGYPVFLESPPESATVYENSTLILNCHVIGFPPPRVRWFFRNNEINSSERMSILDNKTLVVDHMSYNDSGVYTCIADNSERLRRSKATNVIIFHKPRLLCCQDKNSVGKMQKEIKGKHVTLNCSASAYPKPNYVWHFNNRTLSHSPVLDISKVSDESEGVYYCNVSNEFGSLIVKIHLVVQVSPNVSVDPVKTVALIGEEVVMECSATGKPKPQVKWYSSKGSASISDNHTLVLTNISHSDHGDYRCIGKNEVATRVAISTLIVAVVPTFEQLSAPNITANKSASVLISCSAKGPDEPMMRWYRVDRGIRQPIYTNQHQSITCVGLLTSHVKRSDGGIYVCEASNRAGSINTTFVLDVQFAPVPVKIDYTVDIVISKEAYLHCPIAGNPKPFIRWTTPFNANGVIYIPKVKQTYRGRYECTGTNTLGSVSTSIEVRVLAPPTILGLTMQPLQNNWASLTCLTDSTPVARIIWIKLTDFPPEAFTQNNQKLDIDTRYIDKLNFSCNATNAYGWTSRNVRVPTLPSKLTALGTSSSATVLTWNYDPTEFVSHFIIENSSGKSATWNTLKSSFMTTVYNYSNLEPFTGYTFRIRAANVLGTSAPSEILNVTTLEGVPSKPCDVTIENISPTVVVVGWKQPRKPRGLRTSILYEVRYAKLVISTEYVNTNITTNVSMKIIDLSPNTQYVFYVRAGRKAVNEKVYWSDNEISHVTTFRKAPTSVPQNLRATRFGPDKILVSWKKSKKYVSGYKIRYSAFNSTNNNYTIVELRQWNRTDFIVNELRFNTFYKIQMCMFTSGGSGPWSTQVIIRTGDRSKLLNSNGGLPWKIALGGSILIVIVLSFVLGYVYFSKRPKHHVGSGKQGKSKTNRGNRFDDNESRESIDSDSTIHGVYNVNTESDVDLSMFDNSNHITTPHVASNLYIENPILPAHELDSDDSYEAVRLATFTTRPSPQPDHSRTYRSTNQSGLGSSPTGVDALEQMTDNIII